MAVGGPSVLTETCSPNGHSEVSGRCRACLPVASVSVLSLKCGFSGDW